MNIRRTACVALLVAASATGCSNDPGGNRAPTTTTPQSSEAPTASAAAKGNTESGPLKLGVGHQWTDTDYDGSPLSGTTTAISYTQPATGVDLPDEVSDFENPVWAILEVKVCAGKDSSTLNVSQGPWALGFPDDTRLQAPGTSGSGVPKPEYPTGDGALVKAGTCLRGKITFSVEEGTRPNEIIYAPEGKDPVEWAVSKA
ncbi:hypothetical protein [Streptomyces solaniscabiei]|uniref:hypothetical protein n=1 Tax=Streptomyces solaniscabiei TaxID=2683255 RepID=UPI001CE23886|nr:hypothetical protein [Streptomyces solaniscabiei]